MALSLQQKTFMKVQVHKSTAAAECSAEIHVLSAKVGLENKMKQMSNPINASPNMGVIMHPAELCVYSVLVCLSCYADLE